MGRSGCPSDSPQVKWHGELQVYWESYSQYWKLKFVGSKMDPGHGWCGSVVTVGLTPKCPEEAAISHWNVACVQGMHLGCGFAPHPWSGCAPWANS